MIATDTISVLHFEDDRINQQLIKDSLTKILGAEVTTESTLRNKDFHLDPKICQQSYDAIICDYMFPTICADSILKDLSKCGVMVIFYTCLDSGDFYERVLKVLGRMPNNFKFIKKASPNNIQNICTLIRDNL